jgi:hypothetical protein
VVGVSPHAARVCVCAGGEQERHRHRIQGGDKRQSEQADQSLKIGGRCSDQISEVSDRANVGFGAPTLDTGRTGLHKLLPWIWGKRRKREENQSGRNKAGAP